MQDEAAGSAGWLPGCAADACSPPTPSPTEGAKAAAVERSTLQQGTFEEASPNGHIAMDGDRPLEDSPSSS
jgi:hypothetical protein